MNLRQMAILSSCVLISMLWLGGCSSQSHKPPAELTGNVISGTVSYIELEGGFFGIITENGEKYNPINLADEYKKDGLRVKASISILKNTVTIQMWGIPIRINQISLIE